MYSKRHNKVSVLFVLRGDWCKDGRKNGVKAVLM